MFFRCIAIVACVLYCSLRAEFKFEEYVASNVEDFLKDLWAEFPTSKDEEYKQAQKDLANSLKSGKWAKGLHSAKAILIYHVKDPDVLIDVAMFAYQANGKIKRSNYEYSRVMQAAAFLAYQNASSNLQKAKALLLYTKDNYAPGAIEEANKLYPFGKLREEDTRFKDINSFKFSGHNLEESPQGAILRLDFSHNLSVEEPENYLDISPAVDGFVHAEGSTITASGFQSGVEYKVKIRPGIQSVFDEKIDSSNEVDFFVNDLKPIISFPDDTYIYPKQEKIHLPVRAINIDAAKATLYRIPDRNIVNHLHSLMRRSYNIASSEKLLSTKIDFDGKSSPNKMITKNLDLTKSIPELKPGVYVLSVSQDGAFDYQGETQDQWFIVTDIGLSTFKGDKSLIVQARAFSTAKPLGKVKLELICADNDILGTVETDSDGFAEFPKEMLRGKAGKRPVAIFAKSENLGFSFLSLKSAGFDFSDRGAKGRFIKNDYDAMTFCDRGIYRPGEKVNAAVILRDSQGRKVSETPLIFVVKTPGGTELKREVVEGDDLGFYHVEYNLPDDCPTGMWQFEIFVDPTKEAIGNTDFRVDDFSPNKMELSLNAQNKSIEPGSIQKCTLNAHYLYGAPVHERKALLEAKISSDANPFPKWKEYHFGLEEDKFVSQVVTGTASSILDGKAELTVSLPRELNCSKVLRVDLTARLADTPSSQQAATAVNMLTQPYVVGIKEKNNASSKNIELEIISVDCEGNLVPVEGLEYTIFESESRYQWSRGKHDNWSYQTVFQDKPIDKQQLVTKLDGPITLTLDKKEDTGYAIEIRQKDGKKIAKYHLGKKQRVNKQSPEILEIVQENKAVVLGDAAILKVNSPFDGEATVITGLNSVHTRDTVHLSKGWNNVKVPTDKTWGSGAYVLISLVRPLDKKIKEIQPKRLVCLQWIQVEHKDSVLDIKLDLPELVKPKSKLKVPVRIENLKNEKARLVLAIVDEGVIGLTNFAVPDPIKHFFGQREFCLEMRDVYGHIIDPIDADVMDIRSGGDSLMLRRGAFVPRINDKVLSFFDGNVQLDQNGKAEVQMDIPMFFGKLKVYAVAVTKNKMGNQSGSIVVKDNLIVDPYLPNFLTIGDENQFNVRLENTSDEETVFEINIALSGAFKEISRKETIKLNPQEQKNILVEASAEQVGEGTVNIEAKGKAVAYNNSVTVDIRPAQQPVMLSLMQEIKPNETINLSKEEMLKGLSADKAEADLFISNQGPWNLGKVQKWLLNYPFGCNQQMISKGFAVIFSLKQCDEKDKARRLELQRNCNQIIELLNERQNVSGSWGMWSRDGSDLKIIAYAIEMLNYAQENGIVVPKSMLEKAMQFAKNKVNSADWQIRQDRQKADQIAWFVKLCSQSKRIDTATTRYCFDTYFEKCETAVGKALLVAAAAGVQDLGRVKRGVKDLETLIGKGISLDSAAEIVAALIDFKDLEPLAQLLQKLNEILNHGLKGDVTKLNTQTLAMILRSSLGYVSSAGELKVAINDNALSANAQLTHALKPLDNLAIKNDGKESVWLFVNTYGIPKEKIHDKQNGMNCKRAFYKIDGTKVDQQEINLGERIVIVVEGKMVEQNEESYLMLSDWLPAGFSHTNAVPNYDWLKGTVDGAITQKRHDRYIASWKHSAKVDEFKIAYEVIATHTGKFQHPGLHVENMMNPSQYATYAPSVIKISEKNIPKKDS